MPADPKSAKKTDKSSSFFALLGFACVKDARGTLMKLTHRRRRRRFFYIAAQMGKRTNNVLKPNLKSLKICHASLQWQFKISSKLVVKTNVTTSFCIP